MVIKIDECKIKVNRCYLYGILRYYIKDSGY